MKRLLPIALILILPALVSNQDSFSIQRVDELIELTPKEIEPVITEADLINALIHVESHGNDSAVGDRHLVGNEAVGALQIRPIMFEKLTES